MNRRRRAFAILLAAVLLLAGCNRRENGAENTSGANRVEQGGAAPGTADAFQSGTATPPADESGAQPAEPYIDRLVRETVALFSHPGMSDYEKVKAAFDYMIETTTLVDPVGLDLWRIRGDYAEAPPYLENRSLSVLLFHMGKCEDYAAAYTLLLRGMGLEAEYVPGLTYSSQGALVDHAWTVVRVDGVWYHVDCQLEQNISRHGSIRYKYFMNSDATMSGSHRWGENLISARLLTQAQNDEIARGYTPPACPQDYPTPERRDFSVPEAPDAERIVAAIEEEFRAYEAEHGPLAPMDINTVPPVFGLEGYGPRE